MASVKVKKGTTSVKKTSTPPEKSGMVVPGLVKRWNPSRWLKFGKKQ